MLERRRANPDLYRGLPQPLARNYMPGVTLSAVRDQHQIVLATGTTLVLPCLFAESTPAATVRPWAIDVG